MSQERIFTHHLHDILDAISKIKIFIKDSTLETFLDDHKTQYAVIRALEIIGEAVKQLPAEITSRYPDIPWQEITGMRDKLIHHYYGVDLEVVWITINEDLESLQSAVQDILDKN